VVWEYPKVLPLASDPEQLDGDLERFFAKDPPIILESFNTFFKQIVMPMYWSHQHWKDKKREAALEVLQEMPDCDWRMAAAQWYGRRMGAKK